MATMNSALRIVLQHMNDTGDTAAKSLDTDEIDQAGLTLSGYEDLTPGRRIRLGASAADQAVAFTDALGILIVSHDYPFSLRLAAGETLLTNLRAFVVWADDTDDGVHQTSCLLTGNGSYAADLEAWIIEKP
jgi:hypothetical protein